MNHTSNFLILWILLFTLKNYSQENNLIKKNVFNQEEFNKLLFGEFQDAVNLVRYLPEGFLKNGEEDYTQYIQRGLNENRQVIFPDFPIRINPTGITIPSNTKVLFQKNSLLIMEPNDLSVYRAFTVENAENINIYFLKIQGDRNLHIGNKGQWGTGLKIGNSKNIYVFKPEIYNFWGDGIYIGTNIMAPSEIIIHGGWIHNNRRNGISIISGRDITIEETFISDNNGHNPQSGIDIEPNNNDNVLENINLLNITTAGNNLFGIVISTGDIVGKNDKNIIINIENHKDVKSRIGLGINLTRKKYDSRYKMLKGVISIKNSIYDENEIYIRNSTTYKTNIKIKPSNISIIKATRKELLKDNVIFFNSYDLERREIK